MSQAWGSASPSSLPPPQTDVFTFLGRELPSALWELAVICVIYPVWVFILFQSKLINLLLVTITVCNCLLTSLRGQSYSVFTVRTEPLEAAIVSLPVFQSQCLECTGHTEAAQNTLTSVQPVFDAHLTRTSPQACVQMCAVTLITHGFCTWEFVHLLKSYKGGEDQRYTTSQRQRQVRKTTQHSTTNPHSCHQHLKCRRMSTTVLYFPWLLLLFSRSVVSDSLQPYGLQHTRPPCPSPTPRACSNSRPLSWWCHPIISSSVVPFSCLQSFPASVSFLMSWLFASDGQSIGASASGSVLLMNIQDWFPLGLTGLISWQCKGLSRTFSNTTYQKHQFFDAQPL